MQDYLAIMSSSVSSECTFSQGGITISKHCNCLKGDIVEALQCIKCFIWHDLLFREPALSLVLEEEMSDQELEDVSDGRSLGESDEESEINEHYWDDLLIEDLDSDENLESMYCST